MNRPKHMTLWRWWLSRPLRYIEGWLYNPIWLDGSDWCGEVARKIEGEW